MITFLTMDTTLTTARKQFIDFLKEKSRSSSTILAYGKDVEQLVEYLKSQGVEQPKLATPELLQSFMQKLANESYTPKSISRKTNSTKTFFKFLKSIDLTDKDPAVSLTHPIFETKPPRILSPMEYRALRDAARGDTRMSAIIELLLQSGIRIGELAKVTINDISLESENPNIHVKDEEGSVERTVPLTKPPVEAIKKYLEIRPKTQSKALFITKTGRPLLVRNIRTAIDRYFRLAGIKGAKVNDLRHTWVTHQLSSGISLSVISKLAGHKRVSTTEKYLQYVPARTAEDKIKLEEL